MAPPAKTKITSNKDTIRNTQKISTDSASSISEDENKFWTRIGSFWKKLLLPSPEEEDEEAKIWNSSTADDAYRKGELRSNNRIRGGPRTRVAFRNCTPF